MITKMLVRILCAKPRKALCVWQIPYFMARKVLIFYARVQQSTQRFAQRAQLTLFIEDESIYDHLF